MQKLKVLWKSSATREDISREPSMRAAAMASSSDVPSVMTKFLRPLASMRAPAREGLLEALGPKV